mgnify:FL=1
MLTLSNLQKIEIILKFVLTIRTIMESEISPPATRLTKLKIYERYQNTFYSREPKFLKCLFKCYCPWLIGVLWHIQNVNKLLFSIIDAISLQYIINNLYHKDQMSLKCTRKIVLLLQRMRHLYFWIV